MNETFLCKLTKKGGFAKYLVFSMFFVLSLFIKSTDVKADFAPASFPYTDTTNGIVANTLSDSDCAATNLEQDYIGYTILSSNYGASANSTSPCVTYSYQESGKTIKYFYVRGTDARVLVPNTTTLQTIQFKINTSAVGTFTHVAIYEGDQTLGSTASYDLYKMNGTTPEYSIIQPTSGTATDTTYYGANNNDKGYFNYGASELTFSYAMRKPVYGANDVYINFYSGSPDASNLTKRTKITFYIAKPIQDIEYQIVDAAGSCVTTSNADGKICLVYKNEGNNKGTKDIQVKFPANAAFYFSTTYNHLAAGTTPTKDNITTYNSIYAVNTFSNVNGSQVKYMYYKLADSTDYTDNTNKKINVDTGVYTMAMTIDARGDYVFTIVDIFGTSKTSGNLNVTDLVNRELDMYFLKSQSSSSASDVYMNNQEEGAQTEGANFFEITNRDSLDKTNVQLTLDFFYTLLIETQYAINIEGSIISNPLPENEIDKSGSNFCKVFVTSADGTNVRTIACLTSTQTAFKVNNFATSQSINATYPGLNDFKSNADDNSYGSISNTFPFLQGTVDITGAASVSGTKNKTYVWVNENGSFQFILKDNNNNQTTKWIDVSIIDQLQPVLTFAGAGKSICTSTYVTGGNGGYHAPLFGETGYSADCAAYSKEYDVTANSTISTTLKSSTGRVENSDRFALSTLGDANAKLVYYKTTESNDREFDYADAIRLTQVQAHDQITSLASVNASEKTTTDNNLYTGSSDFKTYTLATWAAQTNLQIIAGNYLQYASGLYTAASGVNTAWTTSDQLQISIDVSNATLAYGANGTTCNNSTNSETCYDVVNNYIDRGIDFEINLWAMDYVGNISDKYTIEIDVIDDTTAGIVDVNHETGVIANAEPAIQLINIDTTCRLEVGNLIQHKNDILGCYGFLVDGEYIFADNKSGRMGGAGALSYITHTDTTFANVLSYQWYEKYGKFDDNIKVYIQKEVGSSDWLEITESSSITLKDAGYYKIKFEIKDNVGVSPATDPLTNTVTLIAYYYVNAKVLLIAPHAETVVYGSAVPTLKYDVYTTANEEAFWSNIYEFTPEKLVSFLPNYVKQATSDNFGNQKDFLILDNRAMAGELKLVYTGDHTSGNIWTDTQHKINTASVSYSGSYYITLGDLNVINTSSNARDNANYIIRLHPAYIINGKLPSQVLATYDDASVKENVSNVHVIIQQKKLDVVANGGTKIYGVADTNYKYYDNASSVVNSNELLGYLNGYTVSGFVTPAYSGATVDSVATTYSSKTVIDGTLRRLSGEAVGSYTICNTGSRASGTLSSPNDFSNANCTSTSTGTWSTLPNKQITIAATGSTVYYYDGSSYQSKTVASGQSLIGYYVVDDGKYYKITYENMETSGSNVIINVDDDTWQITLDGSVYDDSTDALQIVPNTTTRNKDYVISYTTDEYTITTRELVIQPGINQGKEYSNPAHADPVWQIVIYGEVEKYIEKASSGFNGYTVTLKGTTNYSYSSTTPTNTTYSESTVYFNRRKKTDEAATYKYQYTISMTGDVFTLDGVDYKKISGSSICRNTGSATESECYSPNGDGTFTIGGLNVVTLGSTTVTVTITGNLQYQNYTLFKSSSGAAGTGTISRASGETIAWYTFVNGDTSLSNLLPVLVDQAGTGANYSYDSGYVNSFNDNAPSYDSSTNTYLTLKGTATNEYAPDGTNECKTTPSTVYSLPCTGSNIVGGGTSKQVLFEIFKRDVILSFNYRSDAYGYSYADFKYWYLDFSSSNSTTPQNFGNSHSDTKANMITCYYKDPSGEYTVGGTKYKKADTCSSEDIGLAPGDSWASSGLGLKFWLELANPSGDGTTDTIFFNDTTSTLVYALPAGMHYVSASITNENYRLIYVDYHAVKAAGDTSVNGIIDIKESEVTLNATSYQKEFGNAIYDTHNTYNLSGSWETNTVNIFDLNYVGCNTAVGCGYSATSQDAASEVIKSMGSQNTKNLYNALTNIYGYTVVANTGFVFASEFSTTRATVYTDTIYNSFKGLPARERYANATSGDKYGLLDGAGRYVINLTAIAPVYTLYSADDATLLGATSDGTLSTDTTNNKMIKRYTSYKITTTNNGTLFILPARIDIEVVSGQKKMYGCSYNGTKKDTTYIGAPVWSQDGGYTNCDESIADYYDLGYTYKVYGDKTYELLDNSSAKLNGYDPISDANTIKNYGSVNDVSYNGTTTPSYTVVGIVSSHANAVDKNNISYTVVGEASTVTINNSSLNNGVLYRAPTSASPYEYSYSDYWTYANNALAKTGGKYNGFQNQSVGSYVLTLGNLDSVFNANNHCNATSDPTSDGGNTCKNFIVYKGDSNNTKTHTKSGTESVSDNSLKHVFSAAEFTIEKREVKLHTEYNYKVYGDTDSLEGFTCDQIAQMYTRTSGYNSGATFSFTGRTGYVCNSVNFVNMGTARFYAVDNSLAKAPWTQWSDGQQGSTASSYYLYDDILWDVISGLLARTNESGNKSDEYNAGGINDKVAKYKYDWSNITLRNGDDYTMAVLQAASGALPDKGFYAAGESEGLIQRWYKDNYHKQLGSAETKNSYPYYSFIINDKSAGSITASVPGQYPFTTFTDREYGDVYYEIVKREIIIVANDVSKVYGIEDAYALFTVKLCSTYDVDSGDCELYGHDEAYGNRYALAADDYTFFMSGGDYNQLNIKGYTDSTGYGRFKGTATANTSATTRGSFGIYFYRATGEAVGDYTVKACPTQTGSEGYDCTATDGEVFNSGTDGTSYNAANYIITSYTGTLTINSRTLKITPNSGQGFQYGNYETGTKIAPITFYENYTGVALGNGENGYSSNTETGGLVNGAIGVDASGTAISDDSLSKQYALCLYNISNQNVTCINDRQNSTVKATENKSYTGQYTGVSGLTTSVTSTIGNVYNDDYSEDNDSDRFALDRVMTGTTSQRYNRNVGTYTIVAGELEENTTNKCSSSTDKTCLNVNYSIGEFIEGVTYEITPAAVTLTVKEGQSKIYGQQDVELEFKVVTTFTTDELPYDYYYCGASQDACKQKFSKLGSSAQNAETELTFNGSFAYAEDNGDTLDGDNFGHNYGSNKASNKSGTGVAVSQTSHSQVHYFDKYCLTGSSGSYSTFTGCTQYNSDKEVTLTYSSSDRILLGYFYVKDYAQTATVKSLYYSDAELTVAPHKILNGMTIAFNEHGEKNYTMNFELRAETGVTFAIDRLELQLDIEDITKTYGEATDYYKCEAGGCNIRTQASEGDILLKAKDNENRLEFNFNVTDYGNSSGSGDETGVEEISNKVILTHIINGKYYTQTAAAEYKNIHLGLSVIRSNEAVTAANTCSVNSDLFGCEDATDENGYKLQFLHSAVTDTVDNNYKLHIGSTEINLQSTDTNFIAIQRATSGNKDTKTTFAGTDEYVVDSVLAKLVINKRDITFYIGTYNSAELVDERFTIEQEEMLPEMPTLKKDSYAGQMAWGGVNDTGHTDPYERQVYFITWFDNDDPTGVYARQVRTADTIASTASSLTGATSDNAYGIAYCRKRIDLIGATYSVNDINVTNCGSGNVIYPSQANVQVGGVYNFDTSAMGTYAMIRDKQYTGVFSNQTYNTGHTNQSYEAKNYTVEDINGTLIIYEDRTAPTIQVPAGMTYKMEANADTDATLCASGSEPCGKQVSINVNQRDLDTLGNIIKYLTQYYSNFTLDTGTGTTPPTITDSNTLNLLIKNGLVGTTATENADIYADLATTYCRRYDDTGCTKIFEIVNNPGVTSGTTTYSVDRAANTYQYDDNVINDGLRAISSIISWFNITSYDYGYIREGNWQTKRYTPRYYIFINGEKDDGDNTTDELGIFDPRFVGDFTISIYAVDNIGNISQPTTVTLSIKDETKPVVGETRVFNAPVTCNSTNAKECATDITKWIVKSGSNLIHINSFIRYTQAGVIDDVNGTHIKVNGSLVSLFSTSIQRYNAAGNKDITGMYVKASELGTTPATEIEHRYWSNTDTVYAVVIGGSDNSYVNTRNIDDAQWQQYYKVNTSWYQYTRTSTEGVAITTNTGINDVMIAAIDEGRVINATNQAHSYYKNLYLAFDLDGSDVCSGLSGCNDTNMDEEIERDKPVIESGRFSLMGSAFTIDAANDLVRWGTSQTANIVDNKFTAGILTCEFTDNTYTAFKGCKSDYNIVYQNGDKVTVSGGIDNYNTPVAALNISDLSTASDGAYYRDRKLVYIDKDGGIVALIDHGYSVFEFGCANCTSKYDEKYMIYNDTLTSTKGTLSTSGTAITDSAKTAKFADLATYTIRGYTGAASTATADGAIDQTRTYSGVASFTEAGTSAANSVNVMSGTNVVTDKVNYFHTYIRVYLGVRSVSSGSVTESYFKYIIIWNGASFDVFRVQGTNNTTFGLVESYTGNINVGTLTTIEAVLEKLVSTDADIKAAAVTNDTEYQFDIDYSIYDVAGNLSKQIVFQEVPVKAGENASKTWEAFLTENSMTWLSGLTVVDGTTKVRGITFVKLSSSIRVEVNAAANAGASYSLQETGHNTYAMTVNQGMSLKALLPGFSVSNINNDGINNMSSVRQSLYYNGEALFENIAYNSDILSLIDDYAQTPGTYTLRLTSTREVTSQGVAYVVDDTPLEITFVIEPAVATVINQLDNSKLIASIIAMGCATIAIIGLGYVCIKKSKENN